jgi:hypothetical protein
MFQAADPGRCSRPLFFQASVSRCCCSRPLFQIAVPGRRSKTLFHTTVKAKILLRFSRQLFLFAPLFSVNHCVNPSCSVIVRYIYCTYTYTVSAVPISTICRLFLFTLASVPSLCIGRIHEVFTEHLTDPSMHASRCIPALSRPIYKTK